MSRPLFLTSSLFVGLLALPGTAAADSSGLELISDPAARQAAETIACTSLPARHYLRHALRDVDARRWGTVMTSLQTDTVDLVADAVYQAASSSPAGGDILHGFIGDPATICTPNERNAARRALDAPEEQSRPTAVDECLARPLRERRRDPACSLAAAVRGGLDGDILTAREHVADVVAAATFDLLYTGQSLTEAQTDTLFEHVASAMRQVVLSREDEETIDTDVTRAYGDVRGPRIERCKDDGPQSTFCAATRVDYKPTTIKVDGKAIDTDASLRAAHGATSERMAELFLCEASIACAGGKVEPKKASTVKLEIGDVTYSVALAPKTALRVDGTNKVTLATLVESVAEIARFHADVRNLVREQLLGEEPAPTALRDLAVTALRLRSVARRLDDAVRAGDHHAFIIGPLEVLSSLSSLDAPPPVACNAARTNLDRMRCATTGELRALIIAAEENHVRELAVRVSALVEPRDRTSCVAPSAGGLLDAFAANVPETHPHADLWAGLEQVRGASREIATCATASTPESLLKFSMLPTPGLRASWNSAYFNAWGSDGFRIVPSLDFVSLRLRLTPSASHARVALAASLFDPFAPLAELAMRRPDLRYHRQELLWLDAIRPRVDLQFAVPSISRHISLTGGFALRAVAPYRGGIGLTRHEATYLTVGTPGGAASAAFASYVEYSVGAKYAF